MDRTDLNPVVNDLLGRLSSQSLDGYEIFASAAKGLTIEVRDGALDVFVGAESVGLSVRAVKGHRLGFAFCTDFSSGSIETLLDRVLQGVGVSDPDAYVGFPVSIQPVGPHPTFFDTSLATIPVAQKIDKARALEQGARSYDPRIKKIRKAGYGETTGQVVISNHTGLRVDYQKTYVSGSILVVAEEAQEAEMGWDYGFSPFFERLDMDAVGRTAAQRAVEGLGARPVKSMNVAALLPPCVACDVLQALSESFAADNVQKGKSLLIGRSGEQVFSPLLSIVDNGLLEGGMATSPCDDEGTPHGTTRVVSGGILAGFLYDQYTANKEGKVSTGNAGRHGIKAPPAVQPTNFYVEKGSAARADLLASLDAGLLVTDLMGIHTADPISGDFSVGATGQWVEKGQIAFPVKGIAVSGNLMRLFKDVDAVGDDLIFYGPFGSPTLRVSSLDISGSGS